jgi:hypothetical protein
MTHPMHSDACKCECDKVAQRVEEIIAAMKSNNGTHDLWICQLEDALHLDYDWNKIPKL